ncbi:cell division protein FtsA [Candidatus Nomurabacteria bacterium]|nr:cell division protein FtsA [Candidatus Nomurabacteria bacterium]
MIRNISIGIDLGSQTTRVVVGEFLKGEKNPKVIGIGESTTNGIRHGYIINKIDAVNSLKKAVLNAEKSSGVKITRAFLAMGGVTLRSEINSGMAVVSKADGEVTSLDIEKALHNSENNIKTDNKKIIQVFPIGFKLDGKEVLGRPEGMRGTKLEVKSIFVTCSNRHFEDLIEVVSTAGIEIVDVIASPISSSYVTLSERQKIVGVALVNIGAETVSLSVFENGNLISLHTFSLGGADITNDIALGLKISIEEADNLKLGNTSIEFSKKKLDEIIEARLSDIFELIENHLKKIKRNELLPAGIVWIGASSAIPKLEDLSKNTLKLPSKIGSTEMFENIKTKLKDPAWFTALGLIISTKDNKKYTEGSFANLFLELKNSMKTMLKQLMP